MFAYIRLYLCTYFPVFHNEKMALIAPLFSIHVVNKHVLNTSESYI